MSNILQHYGIKGMRWGVRRSRPSGSGGSVLSKVRKATPNQIGKAKSTADEGAKITKEGDAYKAVTVPFTIDRTQWNVQYGSKSIFADLKDKFIDDNIELQITIIAKAAK